MPETGAQIGVAHQHRRCAVPQQLDIQRPGHVRGHRDDIRIVGVGSDSAWCASTARAAAATAPARHRCRRSVTIGMRLRPTTTTAASQPVRRQPETLIGSVPGVGAIVGVAGLRRGRRSRRPAAAPSGSRKSSAGRPPNRRPASAAASCTDRMLSPPRAKKSSYRPIPATRATGTMAARQPARCRFWPVHSSAGVTSGRGSPGRFNLPDSVFGMRVEHRDRRRRHVAR